LLQQELDTAKIPVHIYRGLATLVSAIAPSLPAIDREPVVKSLLIALLPRLAEFAATGMYEIGALAAPDIHIFLTERTGRLAVEFCLRYDVRLVPDRDSIIPKATARITGTAWYILGDCRIEDVTLGSLEVRDLEGENVWGQSIMF